MRFKSTQSLAFAGTARLVAGAALAAIVATATPANAGTSIQSAYLVDFEQNGANVVATGSGTINIFALIPSISGSVPSAVYPTDGLEIIDAAGSYEIYTGFTGSAIFGSAGYTFASSSTGDAVGIDAYDNEIAVPTGYVSNSALSDTATYNNTTISGLGLTPGIYTYTWIDGADTDTFTVEIGQDVPEPASLAILGLGLAGLGAARRRRAERRAG